MTKITKKAKVSYIKSKLGSNSAWALRCLEVVHANQTADEAANGYTSHHNNIGFTGVDAEILTSFYNQFKKRNSLSPKQMDVLFKKAPKYWKQVLCKVNDVQLCQCMLADKVISEEEYNQNENLRMVEAL